MNDTCVVGIYGAIANFYPILGSSTAFVPSWPFALRKRFRSDGIYSIRRVRKATTRSVRVLIVGDADGVDYKVPARFVTPPGYGICSRFLRELGVTPPPEGKRKTLHLVVTKRRAKK